ncbi:MAG: hypothetical protein ACRCX4_14305 [Bacteroidales bacterium]
MKSQPAKIVYNWNNYYLFSILLIFLLVALFLAFYANSMMEIVTFLTIGLIQVILSFTYLRLRVVLRNEPYLTLGGWSLPLSCIEGVETNKFRVKIYYHEISGTQIKTKSFFIKNPGKFVSDWKLNETTNS